MRLTNILCGPCAAQEVLAGNGTKQAVFRFAGPKGAADVKLTLTEPNGKLADAVFCWPSAR